MPETLGSQLFGPWYDVIGWLVAAGVFVYFALAFDTLSDRQRSVLLPFMRSKRGCMLAAAFLAFLALAKSLKWF